MEPQHIENPATERMYERLGDLLEIAIDAEEHELADSISVAIQAYKEGGLPKSHAGALIGRAKKKLEMPR